MSRKRLLAVAGAFGALAAAAAVLAVVLGGDDRPSALPACGRTSRTIGRPAGLPARFPLPRGTVFASATRAKGGFLIVEGRVPLGLISATRFFVNELPRAGFRLGEGDSESGREAESDFSGHGVLGRFKVRLLFGCTGASILLVSVIRPQPPD